jgi:hypothetical protein
MTWKTGLGIKKAEVPSLSLCCSDGSTCAVLPPIARPLPGQRLLRQYSKPLALVTPPDRGAKYPKQAVVHEIVRRMQYSGQRIIGRHDHAKMAYATGGEAWLELELWENKLVRSISGERHRRAKYAELVRQTCRRATVASRVLAVTPNVSID